MDFQSVLWNPQCSLWSSHMKSRLLGTRLIGVLALFLLLTPPGRSAAQARVAPAERYAAVAQALEQFLTREVTDKQLPALSIALVDDQTIVWARGFGVADPRGKTPAT